MAAAVVALACPTDAAINNPRWQTGQVCRNFSQSKINVPMKNPTFSVYAMQTICKKNKGNGVATLFKITFEQYRAVADEIHETFKKYTVDFDGQVVKLKIPHA